MITLSPSPTLYARADESSTTTSSTSRATTSDCSNHRCDKPSNMSNAAIAVAVVVPVIVVAIVLGGLFYWNYRKNKQEALDDDNPDFNADNTILPDFHYNPGSVMKHKSEMNPFEDDSLRYPNHMDSFILPYSTETQSKKSLDSYSKNLGDYPAYRQATPNSSTNPMNNGLKSEISLATFTTGPSMDKLASSTTGIRSPVSKIARESARTSPMRSLRSLGISLVDEDFNKSPTRSHEHEEAPEHEGPEDEAKHGSAYTVPSDTHMEGLDDEQQAENSFQNNDFSEAQLYEHETELSDNDTTQHVEGEEFSENFTKDGIPTVPIIPQLPQNSDDEDNNDQFENDNADHLQPQVYEDINSENDDLTAEEAEQIRRMKSVYNTYLKRDPTMTQRKLPIERNSVASSIYPANSTAATAEQYFPHQQFNFVPQAPAQTQRALGTKKLNKLKNLPSPHEFNKNRPFSTAQDLTEFQPQRKFSVEKQENPSAVPYNHMDAWNDIRDGASAPHQLRQSIAMLNPVEIQRREVHKPAGGLRSWKEGSTTGSNPGSPII
ncbi:BA75_02127T0 [Komagataella pastoris]|uniref:BA75_02127T0 n=1 Tax=Komagataella pastoris TaxID=4922 RepID=A0A1B2JD97_PICPA|nr:BA75_02127T0 [Komagataella pastoris]